MKNVLKMGSVALTSAFLLGTVTSAQAASVSAAEILNFYNLVTVDNAFTGSEVEGNIFIGGDFNSSGSTQVDFNDLDDADADWADIVVVGNLNSEINLRNTENSDVVVGGTAARVNNLGADSSLIVGRLPPASVIDPDLLFATLTTASDNLADLATTATVVNSGDSQNANLTFGAGVYDFDLDGIGNGIINFDLSAGDVAIINVAGTDIDFPTNFNFGGQHADLASQIVWNFYEAETVTLAGSAFSGTIFAPFAAIDGFNGSTTGSIFATSVAANNGEIHFAGVSDELAEFLIAPPVEIPVIPLPAGLPLLLTGVGAFGFLGRRRRKMA